MRFRLGGKKSFLNFFQNRSLPEKTVFFFLQVLNFMWSAEKFAQLLREINMRFMGLKRGIKSTHFVQ